MDCSYYIGVKKSEVVPMLSSVEITLLHFTYGLEFPVTTINQAPSDELVSTLKEEIEKLNLLISYESEIFKQFWAHKGGSQEVAWFDFKDNLLVQYLEFLRDTHRKTLEAIQ